MSKQRDIESYINTNTGVMITTSELATACKCTLPTVLTFIKNNPHRFEKVSRGKYNILGAVMTASSDVTPVTNTPPPQIGLPSFEW